MSKPIMLMMVGLVGSGKSTKAQELAKTYDANIHASDSIREELSGDINNQSINDLVFKTLHNRVKEDLRNGKNCIYDATNISYKKRKAFLQELNQIPCEKICVLMATPYETCLKNNSMRDRVVPKYVIERMYRNFDVPWYYEGFDKILVEYAPNSDGSLGTAREWAEIAREYNQNNSHHTLTLGEHCLQAVEYVDRYEFENIDFKSVDSEALRYATMLHDCGKPFCRTFKNSKNEFTEQAHYYDHDHTGSYDSLFYEKPCSDLRVAVLIRWHMQLYFIKEEKTLSKYRRLWGDDLYEDLQVLHQADVNAH